MRSSWNSDKIAASILSKDHPVRKSAKRYCFAQRRGNVVSVCNASGKARFTYAFNCALASALVVDEVLKVTAEDGSVYAFDVHTGRQLASRLSQHVLDQVAFTAPLVGAA